tara:strand:- start:11472 stop:12188 length:717 start_codon:yes stop_codon:yes gene_type:complete
MYNNIAEKLFTKVDLENDDKPCHFKNFISNPAELLTWQDVEDCMNNPSFYDFELVDHDNFKVNIPAHSKVWNYHKQVQDKKFLFDNVNHGHTLIITNYGFRNDKTNELLGTIENLFDVHAAIHVYAGLEGSKSFSIHDDYPSNFIIQIEGKTRWQVYENRISSLFRTGRMNGRVNTSMLRTAIDIVLEPGDALYIPSRAYHAAEPTEARLSISIPCWQRLTTDQPDSQTDRNIYRIKK